MNQKETKERNSYSAEQIQVLEDIEAVRKRPGMYIGSTGEQGVHHLVWEVIDNSIDEAVAGYGNKIIVTLSVDQKSITVTDNGRGIPMEIHSKTKKSTLETIFTVLHSGGKFDHRIYQTSGGLHGVGVTAVNALSSRLKVQVRRDGKLAIQYFEEGLPKFLEILDFKSKETGTSVEFTPDEKIFKSFNHFNDDIIKSRLKELAYLNPQLTLVFSQMLGDGQIDSTTYHYPSGIGSWISEINHGEGLDNTSVFQGEWSNEKKDDHYFYLFLAFQYSRSHRTVVRSFCNNIKTEDGGTHVAGFETGLLVICRELVKEKYPSFKLNISKDDVLEGLTAVVSVRIREPQFIGQTKDKLSNEEVRKVSREATYDLLQKFLKDNREVAEIILQKIIDSASVRAKSEEHLYFLRDVKQSIVLPGKLSDCISKNTEMNEIFIVEGESAGGSAKLGRDRNNQAVLSLKGKVTNAEKLEKTKVLKNDEIKNLINALGFTVTDVFHNSWEASKLRYGKIIIMTDADVDGAHIALLLATFFLKYFPMLIEQRRLFLAVSPLYRLQSTKKEPIYFFNDEELSEYRANHSLRSDTIQRFKGLGEMNPQQLKETTMNPEKRIIHELFFSSIEEAEEQINRLMGIKSDERKLLLESGEHRGIQLLVSPDSKVEVSQFALVNFLRYAYMVIEGRALPHINDGLKPVQRRILYTLYQLNILPNKPFKKSAKVIGEVMGKYHPHGDSSIYQAMVKMTQDFNYRYPLVEGQGNFGSIDGDDAGAHRYCFTGDTRVMTDMGLVQIADIPSIVKATNKLNEIKISSSVNSIGGLQNATKWLYSGVQDVLQITTERGYKVNCTPNEPFYVLNGNLDFEWKDAGKMLIGQSLSLYRRNQVKILPGKGINFFYSGKGKDLQIPLYMSREFAKFLGYLLSNDSLRMVDTSFEFNSSDRIISNDFVDTARILFPDAEIKTRTVDPAVGRKIKPGPSHFYTSINSAKIIAFLKSIGALPVFTSQKRIPEIIFRSSVEEVSAFISAYYEGDGSISINDGGQNLHLHSSSIKLLEEMKLLLLNYFGIVSGRIMAEHTVNSSYGFSIMDGENIVKFREKINFISDRKRSIILKATAPSENSNGFIRNLIPNLSPFLAKYFNEREALRKNVTSSSDESSPKQNVFFNFDLAKFSQIKTEFKLAQYLSKWSDEAKQSFPDLYKKLNSILRNEYFFDRIVSIRKLDEQLPVYDLTIEETNAFVANGFVVHNTEARLTAYGLQVIGDIDFGTVDWRVNYDETEEEPTILPSLLPNLLLNGSSGVAVGMSTNIPPHNLQEVLGASIQLLKNNSLEVSDLLGYINGPDFPTGGIIINGGTLQEIYEKGEGTIYVRCRIKLDDNLITITEIPFKVNKVSLIEEVDSLIKRKKIEGLRSITDYSNWEGINICIRLENGYEPGIILNQLYKRTSMQASFSVKLRSLEEEKPRIFNLKEVLQSFIDRRLLDIKKKSLFLQKKNNKELNSASVQLFIINNYQEIAQIVREVSTDNERNEQLKVRFAINQETVNQILDTPSSFRQFSSERIKRLEEKISSLNNEQLKFSELIKKEEIRKDYLVSELQSLKDHYSQDRRRTDILFGSRSVAEKQLVVKKDRLIILNISEERKIDLNTGKESKRIHSYLNVCEPSLLPATNSPSMGREINKLAKGTENRKILRTNTHADLWCLSNFGKLYIIPVYTLPVQYGKKYGTNLRETGILKLAENEIITNITAVDDQYLRTTNDRYLLLLTRRGKVKKVELSKIGNVFISGKKVINLIRFNDEIIDFTFTSGADKILIFTKEGRYKYFDEKLVKVRGRNSYGHTGIKIRENNYNEAVSLVVIKQGLDQMNQLLLGVTADNIGKKSLLVKMKQAGRVGGTGQQAYRTQYKFLRDKKDRWCDFHDQQIIKHRTDSCCDKSKGVLAYSQCPVFKKLQKMIKLCPDCQGKFSVKYNPLVQVASINLTQNYHYIYVLAGKSIAFYVKNDFLYSSKSKKHSMFREKSKEQISNIFITSQIDENVDHIYSDDQQDIEKEE